MEQEERGERDKREKREKRKEREKRYVVKFEEIWETEFLEHLKKREEKDVLKALVVSLPRKTNEKRSINELVMNYFLHKLMKEKFTLVCKTNKHKLTNKM